MNWIQLENAAQIDQIKIESQNQPVLIFKHSTRCSISSTSLARLERNWGKAQGSDSVKTYYLDLIQYRGISNELAETFSVTHESPQVLLIHNSDCIYDASHMDINAEAIVEEASKVTI